MTAAGNVGVAEAELDELVARLAPLLRSLDGSQLLLTGASGFFGKWCVAALVHARRTLGLQLELTLHARAPEVLLTTAPGLADERSLHWLAGDIRELTAAKLAPPTHIIHAATAASAALNAARPLEMLSVIVEGSRQICELASRHAGCKLLLLSSGAVYGPQPPELPRLSEDYRGGPDPLDPTQAYAEGKRMAEQLATSYRSERGLDCVIARPFAFVGPHLPLDAHFAAGNFIRDALAGGPIRVAGDGSPLRSYLYPTDLVEWLLTILLRGQPGRAYNVGSEQAVSIRELAALIAELGGVNYEVAGVPSPGQRAPRYVPSTARAARELGLEQRLSLRQALQSTLDWNRAR